MTYEDFRNLTGGIAGIFTVIGVIVAVIVYIKNSISESRRRCIESASRYIAEHEKLFKSDGYLMAVVRDMERGAYKRDTLNDELERKFNRFLGGMEHIAILQNAGAVPRSINAYMLGWFCKQVYPVLTDAEKANRYWELGIDFIEETKRDAEAYDDLNKEDRYRFLRKNHFGVASLSGADKRRSN